MINKSLFFSKASFQQVKNYSQNTDKRKNSNKRVHINLLTINYPSNNTDSTENNLLTEQQCSCSTETQIQLLAET